MSIQQRHIDELVADFTGNMVDRYQGLVRATDSPIEAMMLWAIWYVCDRNSEHFGLASGNEIPEAIPDGASVYVIRQCRIGQYRADFALLFQDGARIVVECDGHNFHEKTKQQAQHDKARDRFIQDKGWKVYRFTGGEIFRSPLTCAESVITSLYRTSHERLGLTP